jgi:hypothetical protein
MTRLLSLVLPEDSKWRYLVKGRKALGFTGGRLVTRTAEGVETIVAEVSTYADQPAANAAETAHVVYFNTATGKVQVTTA